MEPTKGCIYYTDLRPKQFILEHCQTILKENCPYPIVSVSLHRPTEFATKNICIPDRVRSYPTMLLQIVTALENLDTDIVFFLEHDVLYHKSHFDYVPEDKEIYYYNINNYRWYVKEEFAITYSGLHSLSAMVCYRETALEHFKKRLKWVEEQGWDKQRSREPRWGRKLGYEPGTKKIATGGFSDEDFIVWRSAMPNIDLRHRHCFSQPKTHKEDFNHLPADFKEVPIDEIPHWNLRFLYADWFPKYKIN